MYISKACDDSFKLSGYRMAAECARNALLQKVVDNKADLGNMPIFSQSFYLFFV